jgi:signal transduction histidine kinase
MKRIAGKLFIGFLCMAALTVGLLWLIEAVIMKDSYLNERIRTVSGALKGASPDSYAQLEESLNISIVAFDARDSVSYISHGLPMRGMLLRQLPALTAEPSGDGVRYMEAAHGTRYAVLGSANSGGKVFAVFSLVDVEEAARILRTQLWTVTGVLLVFSVIIALILSRMFSRPIRNVTEAARAMAAGNLDVSLPVRSKDETGQLTAALNDLGAELRKTEALRRELIANVSHELRAPLSVIRGFAETVRDVTWPDEEKRSSQLTAIADEASRLSDIVGDILDYSRLIAGVDALDISVFPLCPVLAETASRYEIEVQKRRLSLTIDCPESTEVRFDRAKLLQVLYNLLSNALIHARIGTDVRIAVSAAEKTARISVINSGDRIPPEDLPRIWERYYCSERTQGGRPLGTGLGLSIVKSILERHGAAYGVKSDSDQTVFWFETLPL